MTFSKNSITLRYIFIGIAVVLLDCTVFNILLLAKIPLLVATTFGFITGTITGFVLHNHFTFKSRTNQFAFEIQKFFKFIFIAIAGLVITNIVVYFFTEKMHLHYNFSKSIAILASVMWAYAASRLWVFKIYKHALTLENKPIQKMLVFSPFYPPHIGGLESHADEFNKYLSQKGANIHVFTPHLSKNSFEREIKHSNVEIIRFPAFEIIPNYPLPKFWKFRFWQLFLELFSQKYDLVISRTRFFNTSLLALIYAKIKQAKWVHIEHGSDFVKFNSNFKGAIAKTYDYTFGKLVLNFSDNNIANSKASANFCKKLAHEKPCDIVYRGVEIEKIEKIPPDFKLKEGYENKTIITFLGRLIDGKGVSDLLKAVSQIKNSAIICFIIGDGPQRNALEKMTEDLKIKNKIFFFGHKNFDEAIAILKISDIFVNPSYTEGLPTAVIEAALCKIAIIATNVGGTPEIITNEKSGFLIEPKSISLLEKKIRILINDKNLREKFGNNAYGEVKDKFNWSNSIEKYLKIFKKIKTNN